MIKSAEGSQSKITMKDVSAGWAALNDVDKRIYYEKSAADKARYENEMKNYVPPPYKSESDEEERGEAHKKDAIMQALDDIPVENAKNAAAASKFTKIRKKEFHKAVAMKQKRVKLLFKKQKAEGGKNSRTMQKEERLRLKSEGKRLRATEQKLLRSEKKFAVDSRIALRKLRREYRKKWKKQKLIKRRAIIDKDTNDNWIMDALTELRDSSNLKDGDDAASPVQGSAYIPKNNVGRNSDSAGQLVEVWQFLNAFGKRLGMKKVSKVDMSLRQYKVTAKPSDTPFGKQECKFCGRADFENASSLITHMSFCPMRHAPTEPQNVAMTWEEYKAQHENASEAVSPLKYLEYKKSVVVLWTKSPPSNTYTLVTFCHLI